MWCEYFDGVFKKQKTTGDTAENTDVTEQKLKDISNTQPSDTKSPEKKGEQSEDKKSEPKEGTIEDKEVGQTWDYLFHWILVYNLLYKVLYTFVVQVR